MSCSLRGCYCLALALSLAAAAAAQEPPKPSAEHKILKQQEGVWNALIKANEEEAKGTMTVKMTCGGLWMTSEFVGDFGGQKFEGRGIDGYDPTKKKFVTVWVDSMSASPMHLEGTYNEKKKALEFAGTGPGPDGKPAKYKTVVTDVKDDKFTFSMSMVGPDGKDAPMVTIEYTRKK